MSRLYAILDESNYPIILNEFTKLFGLPEVSHEFSIYSFNDKDELHINFTRGKVITNFIGRNREYRSIELVNKNVKQFLGLVNYQGFNQATMGISINLTFPTSNSSKILIKKSTFLNTIVDITIDLEIQTLKQATEILRKYRIKLEDRSSLQQIIANTYIPRENLFDIYECLNPKILDAGRKLSIDLLSNTEALHNRFKKFSNDYSEIELIYREIVGKDIKGLEGLSNENLLTPVSIIIPSYDSENSIKKVLSAIESQELSKEQKQKIEVVIVDDGSRLPVATFIREGNVRYSFELKIVRNEYNSGLATARNIGLAASKHEHVVFLDSDILISKNYILEHSVRSQIVPNAIFISMKKNIDDIEAKFINSGLPNSVEIDDMRLRKAVSRNQVGLYEFGEESTVEILNDSNYFKEFNYGRQIGIFDLLAMVVGHNISTRRSIINRVGGFSNEFIGWGLEDSFFGTKVIAAGNYVIPVLSVNVYHLNHPPRSGSKEKKLKELQLNVERYKKLLDRPYENV